jgi:hypothetical protein
MVGSYQYLPSVSNFTLGGFLFISGSGVMFTADLMIWWKKRVGLACDAYRGDLEGKFGPEPSDRDPESLLGWLQRAEVGLNYALAAVGSMFYVVGCVLFEPQLHETKVGDVIFIPGSCVLLLSEGWKLYRMGSTTGAESGVRVSFNMSNFNGKGLRAGADLCIWGGSAAFLIASVLFLPIYDRNDESTRRVAGLFIFGSWLFTLSGCTCFYRYFFTDDYPH